MRLSAIIFIRLNFSIFKWLYLKNGTCLHGKTFQFESTTIIIFTDNFLHSSLLGITRRQDRALCNKACTEIHKDIEKKIAAEHVMVQTNILLFVYL